MFKLIMFIKLCKFSKLAVHLNSCSMDLGRDRILGIDSDGCLLIRNLMISWSLFVAWSKGFYFSMLYKKIWSSYTCYIFLILINGEHHVSWTRVSYCFRLLFKICEYMLLHYFSKFLLYTNIDLILFEQFVLLDSRYNQLLDFVLSYVT